VLLEEDAVPSAAEKAEKRGKGSGSGEGRESASNRIESNQSILGGISVEAEASGVREGAEAGERVGFARAPRVGRGRGEGRTSSSFASRTGTRTVRGT
jgi:hypothetical protein